MRKRFRSASFWFFSIALTLCMAAVLSQITDFRYENSDDSLYLKGFMGFEGGEPTRFNLDTGSLLAWLLHALSLAIPSIPWFSVFQMLLLFVSCVSLTDGFLRLSADHGKSWWPGILVGTLYLGACAAFPFCRVNYTTTAALAGAASLVQWLALAPERPTTLAAILRGSLTPLLLFLCAYNLRVTASLPCLAFCSLAMLASAFGKAAPSQSKTNLRLFFIPAALVALCVGLLFGVRLWETAKPELSQILEWQAVRIDLMDYTPFEQNPAPALTAAKSAGLSPEQISLMQEWYFMDESITTDALRQLSVAYPKKAFLERLSQSTEIIFRFFIQNPRYCLAALLLAVLCLLCLLCHYKERSPALPAAALLGLAGACACLYYLAFQGRFLSRGVDTVLFPAIALEAGLFLMSLRESPKRSAFTNVILAVTCAVCLGLAGTQIALTRQAVSEKSDTISLQREADLERFALQNPDKLIFRTPNLLRDTRLFPDVSAGVPINIILWGDWYCRMPGWHDQLRRYGIDGKAFTATDWLRPNVLFATVSGETPPEALLLHIGVQAGATTQAIPIGEEGTLAFYSFALVQ